MSADGQARGGPVLPGRRRAGSTRAGLALLAALAGAPGPGSAEPPVAVEFTGMPAPASAEEIAGAYSRASVRLRWADGRERRVALRYRVLFSNLDRVGDNPYPAGQLYDARGRALRDLFGQPLIAETPDANSLLAVPGAGRSARGEPLLYLVTHYEYDWLLANGVPAWAVPGWYRRAPMTMSLTTLAQDPASGRLRAIEQRNIDFSALGGLWTPCAGSRTPWNTHLGSEEDYDLYRQEAVAGALRGMSELYLGGRPANPYRYGYHVEVAVDARGATSVTKHYSMGRASWEKARVMPDRRTVYMGDDGAHTGLFLYVADRPADLSAGTLYAGRWEQSASAAGGSARITWIRLGHASDAEVEALIERERFGPEESTIFERSKQPRDGFRAVLAGRRRGLEHLRLRPGKERAAAFLESRRYAAYLGATTEFNKMEGVAVDPRARIVYLAMSRIGGGMRPGDGGPRDDIRLPAQPAGGVYALELAAGVRDREGRPMASDWVAVRMSAVPELAGRMLAGSDRLGNRADPERVANPDNLAFSPGLRTLLVGEDSALHTNNFVWAFQVDSRRLARILSLPAGAEATGLVAADNLNGHAYLLANYQHAGERVAIRDPRLQLEVARRIDRQRAEIGYLEGLPGM